MIRQNQAYLNRLNAAIDFLLVFFAYLFSAWFRLKVLHGWWRNQGLSAPMILASLIYAAGLLFLLAALGYYSTTRIRKLTWKLGTLFAASTISIFIAAAVIFIFKVKDVSRGIIVLFYFLSLFLLGGKQIVTRLLLNQLRSSGFNIKHEILVGTGKLAERYQKDLADEPELGIRIDETIGPEDDLEAVLARRRVDEVVIALEPEEYIRIQDLITACDQHGIKYYVIPFYNDMIPSHPVFETVGQTKLINMRANRLERIGWAALKRAFDLCVSAVGIALLSPLLLILAAGVRLSGSGPVLLRETRIGYRGKPFQMLKFRSESVGDGAPPAVGEGRGTKFGSFLQNTSLDQLPRLFNVLKGEMSLAGPWPELPDQVEALREEVPSCMAGQQIRPGLTGWAQVNGYRGDSARKKRVELDLWYIDNWSPWLDLKILFRALSLGRLNREQAEGGSDADIKVIVAAHKPYWMPSDPLYLPVQTGAEGRDAFGLTPDDTGDHISAKNANYCELTGLYWAWKNLKADYLGLAHYRRHFTAFNGTNDRRDVLSLEQARRLLQHTDVLLPAQRHYLIETNYQQYIHAHHAEDLDLTRTILSERCPEYLGSFDAVMKKTKGHRFNMFIMKRELADAYCAWLFDILFELEKRLDISAYNENDRRVFGSVSERLLDVWLTKNEIRYKDIPYIFLEKQNWVSKIASFLKRKREGGKAAPAAAAEAPGRREGSGFRPFVSVIIPAYNAEKTIEAVVDDLLAQTYDRFEIIVVDDGSTDGTAALCEGYRDERIRVIRQPGAGQSNARNHGTREAAGDYVTYVDSDDRVERDLLAVLVDTLAQTGADISCGRIDRLRAGETPKAHAARAPAVEVFDKKQAISEMLTGKKIWIGACCRLIPRKWMLEDPFPDGKDYEDLGNTYLQDLKAEKLAFADVPLYHYVMRAGSITARKTPDRKQCMDYYEAIGRCTEGCLKTFPELKRDAAVLTARDYMSLYLHIGRCAGKDEALLRVEQEIIRWMKAHWTEAALNGKAPGDVRMRTVLFRLSPRLYERAYYAGVRLKGKKLE